MTDTARILGRAFSDDPVFTWLLDGRSGAEERLTKVFSAFLHGAAGKPEAQVLSDPRGRSAAIWLPPGQWKSSYGDLLQTLPRIVSAFGTRTARAIDVLVRTERAHPVEPHWYLEAVGVVPESRGQGIGGAMLTPILERCDAEGIPAYLESSNPRNISFYERHGFVRRALFALPAGCPVITPMWRDPR